MGEQLINPILTTLASAITSTSQTTGIQVAAIPAAVTGTMRLLFNGNGSEVITFTGTTGSGPFMLVGVTRAVEGTASTHASGTQVVCGAITAGSLAAQFLPLAGGTLTGQLTGPGGNTFDDGSGNMVLHGQLTGPGGNTFDDGSGNMVLQGALDLGGASGYPFIYFDNDTGTRVGRILVSTPTSEMYFGSPTATNLVLSLDGSFKIQTWVSGAASNTLEDGSGNITAVNNLTAGNNGIFIGSVSAGSISSSGTISAGSSISGSSISATASVTAGTSMTAATGFLTQAGTTGLYSKAASSLFESYGDVQNTTSTSIQDLTSYTLPASLLVNQRDKVRATFVFSAASNTRTKTVGISAFGTSIYSTALTVSQSGIVVVDVLLIRTSSTSVRCLAYPSLPTALGTVTPVVTDVTGLTLTNSQVLKSTCTIGTGSTAGDVTAKMSVVEFLPWSTN